MQLLPLPNQIWVVTLVFSLYGGTFLAYRDVIKSRPTGAALQLHLRNMCFSGRGWQQVFPLRPLKLTLWIEAVNCGQEKARVQTLEFSQCELHTPMFKPTNNVVIYESLGKYPMSLPFDVPPRDRLNFLMKHEIEITELDPEAFVRGVRYLANLQFKLLYCYVDIDGNLKENTMSGTVSYEKFRNSLLNNLVYYRRNHQLADILRGT